MINTLNQNWFCIMCVINFVWAGCILGGLVEN